MKIAFIFLLSFGIPASLLYSQSKKEQIEILNSRVDSLKQVLVIERNLQSEKVISLNNSIKKLESEITELNSRIKILNSQLSSNKKELELVSLELSAKREGIAELKNRLVEKTDSLVLLKDELGIINNNSTYSGNKTDFLNNYYLNQVPLNNNSFELVLTKIIIGQSEAEDIRLINNRNEIMLSGLPEMLDVKDFTYWNCSNDINLEWKREGDLPNFLTSGKSILIDSKLPKIEILKNKLFSLKFLQGREESFLFNVKYGEVWNNKRPILKIELVNENLDKNLSNESKDIVWNVYNIENECYLGLNKEQLSRLGVKLAYPKSWTDSDGWYGVFIEEGIQISRNKDFYMQKDKYIDPNGAVFLFKLK